MERIKKFFKDEEGLEMSEYALMGAIICLAVAGAVVLLSGSISNAINDIHDTIDNRGVAATT
jgi:pilus assembly protein Flp/PilA